MRPVRPAPAARQQLDEVGLGLLREREQALGTKAAVARELGYTRQAISMALAGRYPADTRTLRAAILARYADRLLCPHLDRDLAAEACRDQRERQMPTAPLDAVRWWQACRSCPHNPGRSA